VAAPLIIKEVTGSGVIRLQPIVVGWVVVVVKILEYAQTSGDFTLKASDPAMAAKTRIADSITFSFFILKMFFRLICKL